MPNPNGNPKIKNYGFKTEREHPLNQNLTFRVDEPTKAKIKAGKLPGWSKIAREAVEKALAEIEEKESSTNKDLQSA